MLITDKLSTELNVNYMDLFNKSNEYNHSVNKKIREDTRLHNIFNENEIDFLACFALEYLKQSGIDSPGKLPDTDFGRVNPWDKLEDFNE